MTEICRRLVVHGRVQGVGYRYWTVTMVESLAVQGLVLRGWVRNRRAGTVEIWAAGTEDAVAALVEACRRGPPAAAVGRVDVDPAADDTAVTGFEQRPTI